MELKEAIKRIRQETAPCTYNTDFDKEECLKVIEDNLKRWFILLGKDGNNSKAIVRDEIKAVLEDINGDSSSNNTNL